MVSSTSTCGSSESQLPESFFISFGAALVDAGLLEGCVLPAVDAVGVVVRCVFDPPELQLLTATRTATAPAAQATLLPVRTVSP
jgi:hypothetical protein